jgi:hypothetical protein
VLGITRRGAIPPLVLRYEGMHLRAQYRYHDLAIEFTQPGNFSHVDSIALPLDALAEVEGRDDSPVVFDAVELDKTTGRWLDRGVPRTKQYDIRALGYGGPFPATAADWTPTSADLLTALSEACETCTDDTPRYALDCVQLRGTVHQIVATDGHQLLIQGDFGFPWDGDLLIRRSPIFACKVFRSDQTMHIGKTETHVIFRIGPWSIFNEIQKAGRFPRVDDAVPANEAVTTRVHLDAEDARFLESALERLPGGDEVNSPATIELNGKATVRAREDGQAQITELTLNRSSYSGSPIRVNTNRSFLGRAIRLGFREIGLANVEAPIVCRHRHSIYAWQPLSADSSIEPVEDMIRIESSPAPCEPVQETIPPATQRRIMTQPARRNGPTQNAHRETNGEARKDAPGSKLASLIHEAEALHTTLMDARSTVARLIAGLRRHQKQSRILSDTLKSLRQLKLSDVPD